MAHDVPSQMTDQRRALLTEREREILSGEADVTDNYRYSVESRIRTRLKERLKDDVGVIRENYPEMFDELLYPVVCQPQNGHSTPVERSEPEPTQSHEPEPEPREPEPEARETITEQQARDALKGIDVTGRGVETQEVRREAILHAWKELRDKGKATTQELANNAFDEYKDERKFGYGESSSHYRGYTFWDSCARDVLKELPGVDAPEQRGNTWYFTAE